MPAGSQRAESEIVEALTRGDAERVAVLSLRAYGSEVLGFLVMQLGDRQHAEEVFAMFAEDLWRAIPALELKTSMRAYAYALARNAGHRFLAREVRKQRRTIPLSQLQELSSILASARVSTPAHARTENKQRLRALRERLSADEQALLTLRIDRKLEWREIAHVLESDDDTEAAIARLRKRFQLLKTKLTRWAREQGWLEDDDA